ncbi:hypothetical protein COOONC_11992 [Cooperia oncophora]
MVVLSFEDWDDFPNGRWGNSSSPAFGDLQDYYLFHLKAQTKKEDLLKMYGEEIASFDDVKKVFANFISQAVNDQGVKVTTLPWNEQESGVQAETELINEQLLWCNENGILTVNSQPSVNGAPSTDPLVGWESRVVIVTKRRILNVLLAKRMRNHFWRLLTSTTHGSTITLSIMM